MLVMFYESFAAALGGNDPHAELQAQAVVYLHYEMKIYQHNNTKHNTIITEQGEIMLSDILHKELYRIHSHKERNQHRKKQYEYLSSRKTKTMLNYLKEAGTEHDRNTEIE